MPKDAFIAVEHWIFDLDNTLYSPKHRLFDQIDRRMTAYIAEALAVSADEANRLRLEYFRAHGTTLKGLMEVHGLAPDAFLEFVHDIDLADVPRAPELGAAIEQLPGRKIVHTNGSRAHGERVLAHLGIREAFEGVYGIEDSDFDPKPQRAAYERILGLSGFEALSAAFFEDTARNLIEPHRMGMRTIWTPPPAETDAACAHADLAAEGADAPHVEFVAPDLAQFLERLAEQPA